MINQLKVLLWKESMIFKGFCIFMTAMFLLNMSYFAFTTYLEDATIWHFLTKLDIGDYSIYMFIACLGLYTKERDDGVQYFLHGLPMSRSLAYTVKSIMPMGILTVYFFVDLIISLIIVAFMHGTDAVAKDLHYMTPLIITAVIHLFVCGVIFSTLSFMRNWGLIVFIFASSILHLLQQQGVQLINYFNYFSICEPPENYGDVWLIPWGHIMPLLITSLCLWLIGLMLYRLPYGYFDQVRNKLKTSIWGKIIPVAFTIALIGGIALLIHVTDRNSDDDKDEDKLPQRSAEQKILQRRSGHFDWTILRKHRPRYKVIVESCEDVYEQIITFLQMPDDIKNTRIQVDACNPLMAHAAGVAYWKKLRINFELYPENKDLLMVFGHEMTHVIIELGTNQVLSDNFEYSRWFHEGLATYVENRFFDNPKYEHKHLALAASWDEIHFDELFDNSELTRERDTNLVYPVGMLWFESLVSAYGDDAPAKLLKVLQEKDQYKKLRGLNTWRSICQDAGFNLEMVRDVFNKRLKQLVKEHHELCSKFPEITKVTVEHTETKLILKPEFPPNWDELKKAGARMSIKVSVDQDKEGPTLKHRRLRDDNTFHIPDFALTKNELYFQIGIKIEKGHDLSIYGEWSKVKIR